MHKAVEQFLDGVCEKVRCRAVHQDIRDELAGHIEELSADYRADGMDADAAAREAVRQMGDCADIGMALDKRHRPRMDWLTLGFMALIVVCGALAMAMCGRRVGAWYVENDWYYFQRFLCYMPVGVAVLAAATFFDYTKLQKYPWVWLAAGAALFAAARWFGSAVAGRYYLTVGPLSVSPMHVAPVLFLIGFAGLLEKYRGGGAVQVMKLCAAAAATLLVLLWYPSMGNAAILALTYAVLLTAAVLRGQFRGRRQMYLLVLYGIGVAALLGIILLLSAEPQRLERMLLFWNYGAADPQGGGWVYQQIHNALSASQWVGPYMLSVTPEIILPSAHADLMFVMLIANAGILAGIGIGLLCSLLVCRMAVTAHKTRQGFGHYLSLSMCVLTGLKFLFSMLSSLGWMPLFGIGLPFLSYGGSDYIVSMAAVGLSLSVWRRGRMLPAAPAPALQPSGRFLTVQDGQIIIKWK